MTVAAAPAAPTDLGTPTGIVEPSTGEVVGRVAVRFLKTVASAAFALLVALLVWEGLLKLFDVSEFIARGPMDVWNYLFTEPDAATNRSELFDASLQTFYDAALGLVSGTVAAVVVSIVFVMRRGVEQTFMPIAMALRSVPLVAMTPLIALIFGRGILAVTVIAGIVTFFPTLVNVTQALKSVPTQTLDLMAAYGAGKWTTMWKVQFPASLPALFASARIAAPLALIGALLAEWLATGNGLGYLMLQSVTMFQIDRLWASVAIVTFASVVLYGIISSVENVVLAKYAPGHAKVKTPGM